MAARLCADGESDGSPARSPIAPAAHVRVAEAMRVDEVPREMRRDRRPGARLRVLAIDDTRIIALQA